MYRFVGPLPAWGSRTLYMARVDPYLTFGCEVCLDIEEKSLKLLEKVQLKFLRRMLGMGSRSMKAVSFSETGIWPIKYRRVYLALKNLCYWIGLDHNRPAWNGLQESLSLAHAKKISWVNDLRIILSRLFVPVELDISGPLQISLIGETMKLVKLSMEAWEERNPPVHLCTPLVVRSHEILRTLVSPPELRTIYLKLAHINWFLPGVRGLQFCTYFHLSLD
jgi:hypothetical protein